MYIIYKTRGFNMANCLGFLSPTGFQLKIEKFPNTVFTAQSISLPEISIGVMEQNTPMLDISIFGDKIKFSYFEMQFIVNENMANYKELFNWLSSVGHVESLDDYATYHQQESLRLLGNYNPRNHSTLYSDGVLEILSNNNTSNNNTIYFTDMFPVVLSGLPFDTTVTDLQYLTCKAIFAYSHFNF